MRIFNAKRSLLPLFLCTLLTICSPIACMPPQELHFEPCRSYVFACFISFCIGAAICAFIHKYCMQQPRILLPRTSEADEVRKNFFDTLLTDALFIKTKQEKITDILAEQKKTIEQLAITNKWMQLSLYAVMYQISSAIKEGNEILKETKALHDESCGFVPAVTYYWMSKYREQKKLLDESKKQLVTPEARLLFKDRTTKTTQLQIDQSVAQ